MKHLPAIFYGLAAITCVVVSAFTDDGTTGLLWSIYANSFLILYFTSSGRTA